MNKLEELYQEAEKRKIDVMFFPMDYATSVAIPLPNDRYAVGLNPSKIESLAKHIVCLCHDMGHCATDSFYNQLATCDIVAKHERHADKWAIQRLIPRSEYDAAIAAGHTEIWDLAEQFDVTEDFMKKAVCYYTYGNLETKYYFK